MPPSKTSPDSGGTPGARGADRAGGAGHTDGAGGRGSAGRRPSALAAVRDRLTVHHGREILHLATPTVLTMVSQTLMWTVDTAFVGRVSSVALAAVGLGGMLTWTAYTLFNQVSRISNTFVAQAHGKGDDEAVGSYTWQGLYLALGAGLLLQLAGYLSFHVLPWTRNPAEVQAQAYDYIKWRSASAVATQVSFCLMGFFMGRRDVRKPMIAGIVANLVNVVLDVWLIFGWSGFDLAGRRWLAVPPLGVAGAAIATSIGNVVQMAMLIGWFVLPALHRRRYRTHRPRRPSPRRLGDIVRVGTPSAWENFVDMASFAFFSTLIGQAGAVSLAASQITVQLLAFSFMPLWGVTIAGSVLVGNWIGAGEPRAAARYARQVYKLALYYALALSALLLLLRGQMFRVFTNDPAVIALGASLVTAAAVFQIGDGLRMIGSGILTGAGDTRFPMLSSLLVLWGGFVPLTWWIVARQGLGVTAAWLGGTACYLLQGLMLYLRFRSNRWQRVRIFSSPGGRAVEPPAPL